MGPQFVIEFEQLWRGGRGVPVERYLTLHPELRTRPDLVLVMIACEVRFAKNTPERHAYEERFPHLAAEIGRLFELRELLGGASFAQWSSETTAYCGGGAVASDAAPAASEIDLPSTLALREEFQLHRKLASGQWKDVYEARQQSTQQLVAVKLPRAHHAASEVASQMLREGRTQSLLNHQSIPPVFALQVGEDQPPVLVEKLIGGCRWSECCPHFSLAENLRILIQVSHAVAYVHREHQLIHRDIKPENVMVNEEFGEVYLVDWGLALHVGPPGATPHPAPHVSLARGISGTPSYMAPEMALGQPWNCTTRTDVFLLGGTLYFLLTGESPHGSAFLAGALLAAARGEIVPPERRTPERDIPSALSRIALKALAFDRADRYADGGEFASALEGFLGQMAAERRCAGARRRLEEALAAPPALRDAAAAQAAVLQWSDLANEFRQIRADAPSPGSAEEAVERTYLADAHRAEVACREQLVDLALQRGDLTLASAQLDLLRGLQPTQGADRAVRLARAVRQRRRQQRGRWVAAGLGLALFGAVLAAMDQARHRARAEVARNEAAAEALQARVRRADSEARAARAESDRLRAEQEALRQRALPLLNRATAAGHVHFDQAAAVLYAAALASDDQPQIRTALSRTRQRALTPHRVSSRRIIGGKVAFDAASRFLVSTLRNQGKVAVWKLDGGQRHQLVELHDEQWAEAPGQPGAWLPLITDCRPIPSRPGEFLTVGTDGHVAWFEADAGLRKGRFAADDTQTRPLTCLAVAVNRDHGSGRLVLGDALDGSLSWWKWRWSEGAPAELERRLVAHAPAVLSVDLHPDRDLVASGGADGAVRLWRGAAAPEMLPLPSHGASQPDRVTIVRFSPGGTRLAAGTAQGRLLLWNTQTNPATLLLAREAPPEATAPGIHDLVFLDEEHALLAGGDGAIRWDEWQSSEPAALWRHAETVLGNRAARSVAVSPDNQWIASSGQDGNLVLADANRRIPVAQLAGPAEEVGASQFSVTAVAVSSATPRVALAGMSHDAFLRVMDSQTHREVRVFPEGPLPGITKILSATAVAISPDGSRVVSGERDGRLVLWDVDRGEKVGEAAAHAPRDLVQRPNESPWACASLAFSHDGERLLSLGIDGQAKIWNASSLEPLAQWQALKPDDAAYDGDAPATETRALFGPGPEEILVMAPQSIDVWHGPAEDAVARLVPLSPDDSWTCAGFSSQGQFLAAGTRGGSVLIWKWPSRELDRTLTVERIDDYSPFRYELDVATLIDGLQLYGRAVRRTQIQSVAFSPDDRLLVITLGDGTLRIADRARGRFLHVGAGHEFGLSSLSRHAAWFSPNGELHSWGSDGTLRTWELNPQREAGSSWEIPPASRLALAPDGQELAIVTSSGECQRWQTATRNRLATVPAAETRLALAAFAPESGRPELYLLTGDHQLWIVDRPSGEVRARVTPAPLPGEAGDAGIPCLAVQPQGDFIASHRAGRIDLWSRSRPAWHSRITPSGEADGPHSPLSALAFSPDGRWLASVAESGAIALWDSTREKWSWHAFGPRALYETAGLCFSPDSRRLAHSGMSPGIAIWDVETGQQLQTLLGHEPRTDQLWQINHLAWITLQNTSLLVSAGGEGEIHLWRDAAEGLIPVDVWSTLALASYREPPAGNTGDWLLLDHPHPHVELTQLAVAPEGPSLLVNSRTGIVRTYELRDFFAPPAPAHSVITQTGDQTGLEVHGTRVIPRFQNRLRFESVP